MYICVVLYWFMKVNEDNQEIGAYMFRRTIPSMHLAPADVRWMVLIRLYTQLLH